MIGLLLDSIFIGLILDFLRDSVIFGVDGMAHSRRQMRQILAKYKIEAWNMHLDEDPYRPDPTLYFSVEKRQARWTYKILQWEKVTIVQFPPIVREPSKRKKKKWRL